MSKQFYGSIDLTVLLEEANKKNPAFVRAGEKNHAYARVVMWQNDEPDKFGNIVSIRLKTETKEESKIFIANLKLSEPREAALSDADVKGLQSDDDLPF